MKKIAFLFITILFVTIANSQTLVKPVLTQVQKPSYIIGFPYNGYEFLQLTNYTFTVDYLPGLGYEWIVGGGTVLNGQGTPSIIAKTDACVSTWKEISTSPYIPLIGTMDSLKKTTITDYQYIPKYFDVSVRAVANINGTFYYSDYLHMTGLIVAGKTKPAE